MSAASLNPQIRRLLYALKRQYGASLIVYQETAVTTDAKTGAVSQLKLATRIRRAVVLPAVMSRIVRQNAAILTGGRFQISGGSYDAGKRAFLIDRRDAPSLVLHQSDWLGYGGRKYEIVNFEECEFETAYFIEAKEVGESLGVEGSVLALVGSQDVELTEEGAGVL